MVIKLILFWNIWDLFLKRSFQWYALYEIIFFFCQKKFHRIYVLSIWPVKSFVHNINEETLVYILCFFFFICQFIIECSDVEDFFAAVDFGLLRYFIRFLILSFVERLLIVHYRLNVSWHYYSFFVNSFNLTFYYCTLLTVDRFSG